MKNALITGGTRGIGRACAEEFLKKGFRVIILYSKSDETARKMHEELGCDAYKADVSDYSEIEKTISEIVKKHGNIDVLVNNAAIAEQRLFLDIDKGAWDRMIDVNLNGVYNVTHEVLKYMVRENSGSIVNISSIWGQCGGSCEVHYSASKAGVIGFTKALAKEMALSGIRVNCVAPGMIDTEMNSHLTEEEKAEICEEIPMGRMGTAEECARLVYFLSSSDAAYITGQTIGINGGWEV